MEESSWEEKIQVLTHVLTHITNKPSLHSQLFISSQIPCYLNWNNYPPILCRKYTNPLYPRWAFLFFLKRVSRLGFPHTSWRSKCPYQQPPPLILARGLEEAQWGEEEQRIKYARKRIRMKRIGNEINPLIPIIVPNLFLFSLMFWNPFPQYK
ncbi:uncharacterized protein LOC124915106 [Impatiens glandulifera]|uniref:uncharacterized protein LOC124915106 n=1 Tax=Impatiens glandulifera TaxID=253017 RepID=UPI001FB16170|nr:uncharacterized protein LOC124915106 [Impatiens glandulifera]